MNTYVIGIAGGSGSGKSTFTDRIKAEFGDDVTVIRHDSYYRAHDEISMENRRKINYDHPDSLETDRLIRDVTKLKNGESVDCPVYDFSQHNRTKETERINPSRILLIEGILVLHDDRLRDLMDCRIYVEADADERILRRVKRDVKERGRDLDDIIRQYLETVKPMHYLYVDPTRSKADLVFNSGMNDVAYDVIRTKIQALLQEDVQ